MPQKLTTVWVDASGSTTTHNLVTSAGGVPTRAGVLACSNADFQQEWEGALSINGAPGPVAAPFQGVRDTAVLQFSTAAGSIVKVAIPAPQASIFLADMETVDPANASIAALVALVLANVVTPGGVALVNFLGGSRSAQ